MFQNRRRGAIQVSVSRIFGREYLLDRWSDDLSEEPAEMKFFLPWTFSAEGRTEKSFRQTKDKNKEGRKSNGKCDLEKCRLGLKIRNSKISDRGMDLERYDH